MVNFSIIWGLFFQFFNLSFHANKCMATSKRNSRIQQIGHHHYYHHRIMRVGEWVPTSGGASNNCTSALLPPGILFYFSFSLFLIRNGFKKTLSVGTFYGPTATRVPPKLICKRKKTEKIHLVTPLVAHAARLIRVILVCARVFWFLKSSGFCDQRPSASDANGREGD
jgi:hypothetical protein